MLERKKILCVAVASVFVAGLAMTSTVVQAKKATMVKCYGVAKKGKNDCGTPTHSCAGQAKTDNDPSEWVLMNPEACKKQHGSLTAGGKS